MARGEALRRQAEVAAAMSGAGDRRLWAVRGAVQAETNSAASITAAADELVRELVSRNGLEPDDLVSVIFTVTEDLDAEFPAVAARRAGLDRVPLICTREIDVPGSMRRVIRALAHYYADVGHEPAHAYLGETTALRSDLHAAQ